MAGVGRLEGGLWAALSASVRVPSVEDKPASNRYVPSQTWQTRTRPTASHLPRLRHHPEPRSMIARAAPGHGTVNADSGR
jgi:hypothetical protein